MKTLISLIALLTVSIVSAQEGHPQHHGNSNAVDRTAELKEYTRLLYTLVDSTCFWEMVKESSQNIPHTDTSFIRYSRTAYPCYLAHGANKRRKLDSLRTVLHNDTSGLRNTIQPSGFTLQEEYRLLRYEHVVQGQVLSVMEPISTSAEMQFQLEMKVLVSKVYSSSKIEVGDTVSVRQMTFKLVDMYLDTGRTAHTPLSSVNLPNTTRIFVLSEVEYVASAINGRIIPFPKFDPIQRGIYAEQVILFGADLGVGNGLIDLQNREDDLSLLFLSQ